MKTKQDLLSKMGELGACHEATEYVTSSRKRTAKSIWMACDNIDWLCWFAFRVRPDLCKTFALRWADKAVRVYAPIALRKLGFEADAAKLEALPAIVDESTAKNAARAARSAADEADAAAYAAYAAYAADAAYAAGDAAAYAAIAAFAASAASAVSAASAAASYAGVEGVRQQQLNELHAMWEEICNAR